MRNGNGQGGVSKLSGNRRKPYVARITVSYNKETGSQVYKTLGYFKTRQEAQAELVKYNKTKYDIDQRQLTFTEVYNDWKDRHFKNISKSSIYGYQMAYRRCEKIYEERFSELKTKQLQEVIDDCDKYSIRRTVKVLFNCLYEYADENDIVEKKYNQYVKLGTPVKVYDKKPFTDEEIKILFENVDKIPFVDTILMMCFTGMRVGEMLKQKNIDIKLDDRYLIGGSKTDAGKNRTIPISRKIEGYIKARYNPDNKYLIMAEGKKITYNQYMRYIWNPIMEQLEMSHTPHECRHFCATALNNAGVDDLTRKYILGHKTDVDITERYTHRTIEQLIDAIDKI